MSEIFSDHPIDGETYPIGNNQIDLAEMTALLVDLVRVPSVGGTDEENTCLADLARRFDGGGLEVDHWQVPLAETLAHPDFPGSEVERDEAWGLVGRLPGRDPTGPTLML